MPPKAVAACLPQDISVLGDLPADVLALAVPSADDTPGECEGCHCGVWVGPRKLALARLGRVRIMCYGCAVAATAAASPGWRVVDLDPDRRYRPRR